MREPLTVLVNIDVEEEGLFSGRYKCKDVSIRNIAYLCRLQPLFERGIKPTLFCAHPVLADIDSRRTLEKMLPYVEIGAHLHHWNTPPIVQNIPASGELWAVPAHQVPIQCLEAKIAHLLAAARDFLGSAVTSFRMGRWDLHKTCLPLLLKYGILTDASVRPLHSNLRKDKGPDHFDAPRDPYWIEMPEGRILEAPLTVAPLLSPFAHIPGRFPWGRRLRESLCHWGALTLLPVNHPLWLMRFTTNLHVNSGGRSLSLTWHSSEMMPGGAPHVHDKAMVDHFLSKIMHFLDWLEQNFNVSYLTMTELRQAGPWPTVAGQGDWAWTSENGK